MAFNIDYQHLAFVSDTRAAAHLVGLAMPQSSPSEEGMIWRLSLACLKS
jgi:hypothetical protein